MRGVALLPLVGLAVGVAAPRAARADADEASIDVHLVGGLARAADADAANDEIASAPLAGLTGRVSYATRDWLQYEAALTFAGTAAASYGMGTFTPPGRPPATGPFSLSTQMTRLELGVSVRFGVRLIPTLRVFAGAQGRHRGAATVDLMGLSTTGRDAELTFDLVGGAAVGLDYRVNRRTIVGVAVGGTQAVPLGGPALQTLEGYAFWSYYFYPRW